MPAVTYLSEAEVQRGRTVPDDTECDDLLQELRAQSGEDWIILTRPVTGSLSFIERLRGRSVPTVRDYTLYADCHGEWQIINLSIREGGSVFHASEQSRDAVVNFMLGMLNGLRSVRAA